MHGKITYTSLHKGIRLKNITFGYTEKAILQDINLILGKNETVAFIGESGSGKTTLVNLISGIIKSDRGAITVDDITFRDLNLPSFQQKIGYITQDPVIFNDTIFNNITFWAADNEENKLRFWSALKSASIDQFVNRLPEKENSLLGNNGILVSGGQKQRLSIARELYKKDVEILILDEATSALDSETEKVIQQNIDALKGRYTILIVAHRLSTIKNADKIVLLNEGRIDSVGTFEELANSSERFKKMIQFQEL